MRELIYVGDPMCSWCWGFSRALSGVHDIVGKVPIRYVMGGLARDSDEPMPDETRAYIQGQWRKVTEETGAEFNWAFWEVNAPRRSTYPSCRAVIAAAKQDATRAMFEAIQHAYYQEARNPSDVSTLIELAGEIGLDPERFGSDIASEEVEQELQDGFNVRRALNANEFPSLLAIDTSGRATWLARGYADPEDLVRRVGSVLN